LNNAIKYGAHDQPIRLMVDGRDDDEVWISVHNFGRPIPQRRARPCSNR
jgi:signal transduction histidine kinase